MKFIYLNKNCTGKQEWEDYLELPLRSKVMVPSLIKATVTTCYVYVDHNIMLYLINTIHICQKLY